MTLDYLRKCLKGIDKNTEIYITYDAKNRPYLTYFNGSGTTSIEMILTTTEQVFNKGE